MNDYNRDRNKDTAPAETPVFPMRINKYLAMQGKGSRRDMDVLVAEGKVIINGAVAVLGTKVKEGDKVEIKFRGAPGANPRSNRREQRKSR